VDIAMLAMLAGVVVGRAFFVAQHWEIFARYPGEIPAIWHGGLIWYGGFVGGVAAGLGYVLWHRVPVWRALDQIAPYIALAHGIGRIGCFLTGCCYGRPTSAWFGVTFPGREEAVIPVQLVEAAFLFAGFWGLRRLQRSPRLPKPGQLFCAYLIGYGMLRFGLEFLRGDQAVSAGGLTLQQVISLGVLALGLALFAWRSSWRGPTAS
jgi:phosphatidylglycerol:prolipoprotein diacylglycerol transferase